MTDEVNMNCSKLETVWLPYLDGKLSAQERALVDAHLTACADCAARLEGFHAVSNALESWEAPAPSAWFDVRLRHRIAAEAAPRGFWGWLGLPVPSFPLGVAAMLFLASLLVWSGGTREALPEQLVTDVKMDELLHVMEEVELLNDFDVLGELKKPAAEGAAPKSAETGPSVRP